MKRHCYCEMTRYEAIERAIEIISKKEGVETKTEILKNLEKVKILLKNEWTKDGIFNKINQWVNEHGRNPCYCDLLQYDDMPNPIAIKRNFDMSARAFLNLYYPYTKKKIVTRISLMTKEELANLFITQFNKHKVHSSKEYNEFRDEGTPTWITIARNLGFTRWRELIEYTNVKIRRREPIEVHRIITVRHSVPLYEKLEQLLKERK